jgi:hypothetical protein
LKVIKRGWWDRAYNKYSNALMKTELVLIKNFIIIKRHKAGFTGRIPVRLGGT